MNTNKNTETRIAKDLLGVIGRAHEAEFAFRRAGELPGPSAREMMRNQGREALQDLKREITRLLQESK